MYVFNEFLVRCCSANESDACFAYMPAPKRHAPKRPASLKGKGPKG